MDIDKIRKDWEDKKKVYRFKFDYKYFPEVSVKTGMTTSKLLDFEERLSKEDINGCIVYTGSQSSNYGIFRFNGEIYLTHRLNYALNIDPDILNSKLQVRHRHFGFSNPKCLNPEHLKSGTQSENNIDVYRDETPTFTSSLSNNDIVKIIQLDVHQNRLGLTQNRIGEIFGVSNSVIQQTLNLRTRKYLDRYKINKLFSKWLDKKDDEEAKEYFNQYFNTRECSEDDFYKARLCENCKEVVTVGEKDCSYCLGIVKTNCGKHKGYEKLQNGRVGRKCKECGKLKPCEELSKLTTLYKDNCHKYDAICRKCKTERERERIRKKKEISICKRCNGKSLPEKSFCIEHQILSIFNNVFNSEIKRENYEIPPINLLDKQKNNINNSNNIDLDVAHVVELYYYEVWGYNNSRETYENITRCKNKLMEEFNNDVYKEYIEWAKDIRLEITNSAKLSEEYERFSISKKKKMEINKISMNVEAASKGRKR